MSFKVIKAGFLACIQDAGRFNHTQQGMSQSGVMDEQAYCWANHLLENHFNDALLEITLGHVVLEALDDTMIVVTGADLDFKINNSTVPLWQSVQINSGDILSWGNVNSGVRSYLAVKGGFQTDLLFGSRSVNLRENIGNKITVDSILPCQAEYQTNVRLMDDQYLPNYVEDIILRLLPSYQFNTFSTNQRDLFFNQTYTISTANNRTGCRLKGTPLAMQKSNLVSEGISYGAVEIASDGLPIILLKDAPTIGGYDKIGTVFSLDLAKLAQRQASAKLRFELMHIDKAQQQRKLFNEFFSID